MHTHEQAMSLSDGESFLHLFYARVEPDALLGHTAAPKSVPHDSRLPPVLLSSPLMRHQTPRIFAAPARTGEDALIVEAQSTAPMLSTSRPRSPSSPTRRVHPHPLSPSPRPLTCPAVRACVRLAACPAGAPFSTVLHAPQKKKIGFGGGVLTPPAQRSERPMYAGPLGVRPDVPPASL